MHRQLNLHKKGSGTADPVAVATICDSEAGGIYVLSTQTILHSIKRFSRSNLMFQKCSNLIQIDVLECSLEAALVSGVKRCEYSLKL